MRALGWATPTVQGSKRADTVGEFKSAEVCVSHMPAWKAKKLGKLTKKKYC
jgi:hypothetical protein